MATATTTKRPRKPISTKPANAAPEAPPAEDTTNTNNGNGSGTELAAAYWQALDTRDDKGEIPADKLTAVKAAYTQTDPRKRANLVKTLTLKAADRIVNDDGEVDQSVALARKHLSAALDEVREQTSRSERPPHDPVPDVAGILAALDTFRADLLAALTDDQRDRVPNIKVSEDDTAKAAGAAVGKALDKLRERALNGRSGYSGPRTPAADTAEAVRKAVHAADGPLTLSQLAKAAGIEQSTAYTRHTANNTPGVKAITDDKNRRVFVKDPDPA